MEIFVVKRRTIGAGTGALCGAGTGACSASAQLVWGRLKVTGPEKQGDRDNQSVEL